MDLQVLSEVAFLRKLLQAEVAAEGLDSFVHASVVENIPGPSKLFVAVVELADIDGLGFVFTINISEHSFVLELSEQLEVDIAFGHLFVELETRVFVAVNVCTGAERCLISEVGCTAAIVCICIIKASPSI